MDIPLIAIIGGALKDPILEFSVLPEMLSFASAVRFGNFTNGYSRLAILRPFKCKMASCLKLLNCSFISSLPS
jgi:hypothetical protein